MEQTRMNQKEYDEITTELSKHYHLNNREIGIHTIYEVLKKFIKPAPRFAVGDLVRVYCGEKGTFKAKVVEIVNEDYMFVEGRIVHEVHQKQCRKLKRRENK